MTATPQLTTDLQKLVLEVEDDLRARLEADPGRNQTWHEEHEQAVRARRTAMAWTTWRDDRIVQAAVSWVLTTVFVRFAEDNELVTPTWFTGPGERRHHAVEAQQAFFRKHPELTDREWIEQSFEHLRSIPATAGLVDEHAGLRLISPSGQMATRILEFWRRIGDDGALVHDLADPELSTRFLGDLYQDLSEHAREAFALLQTPEFVEEFILDQTLTPALEERPLEGFKIIDPTCGSGHFLLGAFDRLNDLWAHKAPSMGARERVQKALESVYGVDINAFAVAVARFRLTIAALQACGERSLDTADAFDVHVETGDSLIHGKAPDMFEGFSDGTGADLFAYATEDQQALREILAPGQYDVVVGNPPYITVKDKTLNERYRELYRTCKGAYALTVPFMERFFDLAKRGSVGQPAGWTGQITSNSFMKREFGTKVIETFLSQLDLRSVIDTSGAYIPGHGTPTVVLVGRNDRPQSSTVRAVLGIRGEPGRPNDAAHGLVWSAIKAHAAEPGYEDGWISVVELERQVLSTHPWSLQGGAAPAVSRLLGAATGGRILGDIIDGIGITTKTGADEAFFVGPAQARTLGLEAGSIDVVIGEFVRDYAFVGQLRTVFPYTSDGGSRELLSAEHRHLWRLRRILETQLDFQQTKSERGLRWFDHSMFFPQRYVRPLGIAFSFVATHNHFVLDRGGKVFKQSAPVIKLPEGATEEDHLQLLGVLNSSVACFWLKQNSHNKGSTVDSKGARQTQVPWENFYEFTGTTLKDFPLPRRLDVRLATSLDELAQQRQEIAGRLAAEEQVPDASSTADCADRDASLRRRMVALQEELDWETYAAYGVLDEMLTFDTARLPEVAPGQRAFEIVMARKVATGELDSAWFTRHGSTPMADIPQDWPQDYRELVQRRIDVIESDRKINLLERPEYKRRWAEEPWAKRQERALRGWLLDRIGAREHWYDRQGRPSVRSIGQLADVLGRDEDFVSVLELWAGQRDVDLVATLTRCCGS